MSHEVTATELKNRAGQVLEQAQHEPVIVSRQGRPYVAIIAWDTYRNLQRLQEQHEHHQRQVSPERWKQILAEFDAISQQGRQDVDLSTFTADDRYEH